MQNIPTWRTMGQIDFGATNRLAIDARQGMSDAADKLAGLFDRSKINTENRNTELANQLAPHQVALKTAQDTDALLLAWQKAQAAGLRPEQLTQLATDYGTANDTLTDNAREDALLGQEILRTQSQQQVDAANIAYRDYQLDTLKRDDAVDSAHDPVLAQLAGAQTEADLDALLPTLDLASLPESAELYDAVNTRRTELRQNDLAALTRRQKTQYQAARKELQELRSADMTDEALAGWVNNLAKQPKYADLTKELREQLLGELTADQGKQRVLNANQQTNLDSTFAPVRTRLTGEVAKTRQRDLDAIDAQDGIQWRKDVDQVQQQDTGDLTYTQARQKLLNNLDKTSNLTEILADVEAKFEAAFKQKPTPAELLHVVGLSDIDETLITDKLKYSKSQVAAATRDYIAGVKHNKRVAPIRDAARAEVTTVYDNFEANIKQRMLVSETEARLRSEQGLLTGDPVELQDLSGIQERLLGDITKFLGTESSSDKINRAMEQLKLTQQELAKQKQLTQTATSEAADLQAAIDRVERLGKGHEQVTVMDGLRGVATGVANWWDPYREPNPTPSNPEIVQLQKELKSLLRSSKPKDVLKRRRIGARLEQLFAQERMSDQNK